MKLKLKENLLTYDCDLTSSTFILQFNLGWLFGQLENSKKAWFSSLRKRLGWAVILDPAVSLGNMWLKQGI
jgi:hypothetical protein